MSNTSFDSKNMKSDPHTLSEIEIETGYDKHQGELISDEKPDLSPSNITKYFLSRVPSLFVIKSTNLHDLNPVNGLNGMTLRNWNYFFLGMVGWLSASFDFFCTSVAGTKIAKDLGVSTSDITWGLATVLMVRSAGAIVFGIWTDNYSRKWPFIACCGMFVVIQIGTGFVTSYEQFLACRALSGVAMGGMYAPSAATSLDDTPVKARSFLSGLFYTAYTLGFLFANVFWRVFQDTKYNWRALFWFSGGVAALLILWRLFFPETKYFQKCQKAKELIKQEQIDSRTYVKPTVRSSLMNFGELIQKHWIMFIYLILLMAGPNFTTHSSQDLYPSMLRQQLGFSENSITITIVITQIGACIGSLFVGIIMEIVGRRTSIVICCTLAGCFIYPAWMIRSTSAVIGGGFAVFFAVMGVWGAIPVHLSELSPPDARALFSGLSYQLGNLASSAASTIETNLGDKYPLETNSSGDVIKYDYAKVMSIMAGACATYTLFITLLGPEYFHRDLSSPVMKRYLEKVDEMELVDIERDVIEGESREMDSVTVENIKS
ncbi:Carboxylic acid transporter protein [Wickerhamomyces ciferrii]|uniref:Carboxylic acid transporter protein n=1 Tax=Wickerhamomyces ciferrii (strain ATCC 14091 / BCRC 22168 / CBS 111 / JCM 3599 / NBRC 0793 / NRRL Y-1031 F-60-10) TaxID=1206466 RepID=K0KK81_WICCF|nr:Carboxylic acid transporter protein [Wickerhamomyces ciferrii]CCH43336.1 Carboxylic acid transporter protein [Wickerhamomyces ciferrii]